MDLRSSFVLVAAGALGIGAASFASFGDGFWGRKRDLFGNEFGERDGNETSKDIAESPTAIAGTPQIQFIIHNA